MDYSFFAPPTHQPYQFFSLSEKPTNPYTPPTEVQQDPLDAFNDPSAFQFFDQNTSFDASTFIPPSHSPAQSLHRQQSLSNPVTYDRPASIVNETSLDNDLNSQALERQGSSDDDKESLTPAQSRRKAQNRAAQRAFRERKEKRVKELEVKLKSKEVQSTDLLTDNERLRRELDRLQTQNEILRATSTPKRLPGQPQPTPSNSDTQNVEAGPMVYSPKTFNAAFAQHGGNTSDENITHMITVSSTTGERLLATGAAWDLIHGHDLCRRGVVDLAQVVDKLRDQVVCNGQGPSFPESEILKAIEESAGVPGDELI